MGLILQIIGAVLALTFFGVVAILAPVSENTGSALTNEFFSVLVTTLSIYAPFALTTFFNKKADGYIKVVTIFFAFIATLATLVGFFKIGTGLGYSGFWAITLVAWAVVAVLSLFSIIAVKNVRG